MKRIIYADTKAHPHITLYTHSKKFNENISHVEVNYLYEEITLCKNDGTRKATCGWSMVDTDKFYREGDWLKVGENV